MTYLDFQNIQTDKLFIKRTSSVFYKLSYFGEPVKIITPVMKCVFGIEKHYSTSIMKLQFDETSSDFYKFVKDVEDIIATFLGKSINSQIREQSGLMPLLTIKIPHKKDTLLMETFDAQNNYVNHEMIQKGVRLQCMVEVRNIWSDPKRDRCTCKWHVTKTFIQ